MDGIPCIRYLRIPVATVLRLLASGVSEHGILAEYPGLETEDIRECFLYAASSVMERELPCHAPRKITAGLRAATGLITPLNPLVAANPQHRAVAARVASRS